MSTLSRRALFLLVVVLLAAFALRLFRLDAQSIWWDEGISLHLATSSLAEIVRDRLDNIHPPLYFVALKGWLSLTGVSPFTGRYLSALAALVQVPLVFAFTRAVVRRSARDRTTFRPQDGPIAWIAAALTVIFSLSVIYGQEIRVYAFLPLVFLGLLWLGERLTSADSPEPRELVLLAVVAWLGLHLHYIAAFGVAYVAVWGVVVYVRRGRWDLLARWVGAFAMVGVASLPWFVAMVNNWSAVQAEASAGTFATDPVPLPFLFAQVWAFQLTGLAGALGTPLVRLLAAVTAAVFIALIGLRLLRWDARQSPLDEHLDDAGRRRQLRLLAHWAVPLTLALVVWSLRSFSHPRYVTMYTIAFLPLAAMLIWPARRWVTQTAASLLLALLVFLSLWGLGRYFFNPDTAKSDMRGVAHYLETAAGPNDLIVIPDTDWSLPFEYTGAAEIIMADWHAAPTGFPSSLDAARGCEAITTSGCDQPVNVFVLDYERGTRDWQRRVPFELERRGSLLARRTFDDLRVDHYVLDRPADTVAACTASGQTPVGFGPLALHGSWVEQGAAANTAVAVALCWQPASALTEAYAAAVTLTDPLTGDQVGQSAAPLLDAAGRPTSEWASGQPVLTYHLVPLLPGTPPLDYEASAAVFSPTVDGIAPVEIVGAAGQGGGRQTALEPARLQAPVSGVENPYEVAEPPRLTMGQTLAPGVLLESAVIGGGAYRPGQTVRVSLLWRRSAQPLGAFRPEMRLEQDGRSLGVNDEGPAQGRYPAGQWAAGESVREVRDVRLPAGVDGPVEVVLQSGQERLVLGTIPVVGADVLLVPPDVGETVAVTFGDVADLVGFTLSDTRVTTTESLPVTLVWRSRVDGAPADYAVFVHVVDAAGVIIGQHDGVPGGGQRPSADWLSGEYIVDPHPVTFRNLAYSGPAEIRVGLYEPNSGTRLLTADGADSFTLPVTLDIVAAP